MERLAGKAALITGGGSGIGAATAALFCSEGAAVMLVDSNEVALANTAASIRERLSSPRVATFVADVADGAAAIQAVGRAIEQFGHLNVLVNNAAMRNYSAVTAADASEWRAVVDVNLLGTANYCRAAAPELRNGGGSIVNVSSCYAVVGRKGMGLYDATKAGILAMTRTLAHELCEEGVRVNAVCPGPVLTDFHIGRARASGKDVEALKTERTTISLLGRWASPQEIAWPILWLASDEASFITGTTLMVDGGLSAK